MESPVDRALGMLAGRPLVALTGAGLAGIVVAIAASPALRSVFMGLAQRLLGL